MDWLTFAVLSLATWRLSNMLVREDGPAFVFLHLRQKVGIQHDDNNQVLMAPDKLFPQLLSCVWCTSVWVGFGWMVFWVIAPVIAFRFAVVLAVSTVAILLDKRAFGH